MGENRTWKIQCKVNERLHFRVRWGLLIIVVVFAVLAMSSCGWTQMNDSSTNGTPQPAYDVVSIKANKTGGFAENFTPRINGFTAENVSVEFLLTNAYDIRYEKILQLPNWAVIERYDVVAKILSDRTVRPSSQQQRLMMQQMLATRFGIKAHDEMRDGSVFDLLIAKGGIRIKEVADGGSSPGGVVANRGRIQGYAMSMPALADALSSIVERDVMDRTGLTGRYQVHLEWTPDSGAQPEEMASDNSAPSLKTALQEQLGLKLVPGKGKVRFLVIDRITKPEPN